MSLIDQLNNDLKNSMKSGDKFRTETLRGLKSAIKYAEIDAGGAMNDQGVQAVVAKQAKQRRDSIEEFKKGGRQDLVEKETAELAILETYLPQQMPEGEIKAVVEAAIAELGVSDIKGMGQVMKRVMAELQGQADGRVVNQIVRECLNS
jgi:hypothetical protein